MVKSGDVRRDQASSLVKTVLDVGKTNRSELGEMIRSEIRNQVANLGLATQRDVDRLERRVGRLEDRMKAERAKKKTTVQSSKKTTVKKKTPGTGESRV